MTLVNTLLMMLIMTASSAILLSPAEGMEPAATDPAADLPDTETEEDPPLGTGAVEPLSVKYVDKVLASTKTDPRIKTICGKYKNPDICERTVLEMNKWHDPNTLVPKNLVDIQLASMLEILDLASMDCVALGKVNGLCAEPYNQAIDELSKAMHVCVEDGPPDKVMAVVAPLVEGSLRHFTSCQDKLAPENTSPLIKVNDFLTKLGENTFALANDVRIGAIGLQK